MADVYFLRQDDDWPFTVTFTNEPKEDGDLWTPDESFSNHICTVELYNGKFILPANSTGLFKWMENETFNDTDKGDTSDVTNMSELFSECANLRSLNCSTGDTSKVTNMYYMFHYCDRLENLNISGGNTSNVTNMSYMFDECNSVSALDVSSFNTSKVTDMSYMFNQCGYLDIIDVSKGDTSKVTNMQNMFNNCNDIQVLDLSNWDTSSLNSALHPLSNMFYDCNMLEKVYVGMNGDVSGFVGTASADMFNDNYELIGGEGTVYDDVNPKDCTYAKGDDGTTDPGYFTYKGGFEYVPYVKENGIWVPVEIYY